VLDLRVELGRIAARRRRMADSRSAYFTISLVGYTNAGKSTLLHALTGARAHVADQLFATLDTQTRAWTLPSGKRVFLSDTVGFIRHLPHHLVASFQATLEEVRSADLILHVADGSHPDASMQLESVEEVLREIEAHETPRILVLNKCDRVEEALDLRHLAHGREPAVVLSALDGTGVEGLAAEVERAIVESQIEASFRVPAGAGRVLAFLADRGTVLERAYHDGSVSLRVRLGRADAARASRMAEEASQQAPTSEGAGGRSPAVPPRSRDDSSP
jgi:GTP-binding protein HflX